MMHYPEDDDALSERVEKCQMLLDRKDSPARANLIARHAEIRVVRKLLDRLQHPIKI